jgi:glycerophosphoryl diester phosphodiesterase
MLRKTVEILALTERYGGNAVEIDVNNSRDSVPFLYHDKTINLRLTQKGPVWDNIEDFTFAQLRTR